MKKQANDNRKVLDDSASGALTIIFIALIVAHTAHFFYERSVELNKTKQALVYLEHRQSMIEENINGRQQGFN